MKHHLALSGAELAEVRAILQTYLPSDTKVYAFGSRTNGRAKPWSDLDVVIDAGKALPISILAALAEAFDESALPWKVDLVDRASVSADFGSLIDAAKVSIN